MTVKWILLNESVGPLIQQLCKEHLMMKLGGRQYLSRAEVASLGARRDHGLLKTERRRPAVHGEGRRGSQRLQSPCGLNAATNMLTFS